MSALRQQSREVRDLLRSAKCATCSYMAANLDHAASDIADLRRKMVRGRNPEEWVERIAAAEAWVESAIVEALRHLDQPHEAREPKPVKVARPKVERRPCPRCGVRVRFDGDEPRGHRTPRSRNCRPVVDLPDLSDLPPVVIGQRKLPVAVPASSSGKAVARLDVGSECRQCGKWLPGERSLCGRCYATGTSR